MKLIHLLSFLSLTSFILFSCEKSAAKAEETIDECEFIAENGIIKPFCAWPPSSNSNTIALPVRFVYEGLDVMNTDEYSYVWSSDSDFKSAAISIRYSDLPVTVMVTQISTGCVVEVTLTL